MTKPEVKAKFDEIVDFSGVERYVETPVKRYFIVVECMYVWLLLWHLRILNLIF